MQDHPCSGQLSHHGIMFITKCEAGDYRCVRCDAHWGSKPKSATIVLGCTREGGKEKAFDVATAEEAAGLLAEFIVDNLLTKEELSARCGKIYGADGDYRAHVAFDGRVWAPDNTNLEGEIL